MAAKKLSVDDAVILPESGDMILLSGMFFTRMACFHSHRQPHAEIRHFHFLHQPGLCTQAILILCRLMLLWLLQGLSGLNILDVSLAWSAPAK